MRSSAFPQAQEEMDCSVTERSSTKGERASRVVPVPRGKRRACSLSSGVDRSSVRPSNTGDELRAPSMLNARQPSSDGMDPSYD